MVGNTPCSSARVGTEGVGLVPLREPPTDDPGASSTRPQSSLVMPSQGGGRATPYGRQNKPLSPFGACATHNVWAPFVSPQPPETVTKQSNWPRLPKIWPPPPTPHPPTAPRALASSLSCCHHTSSPSPLPASFDPRRSSIFQTICRSLLACCCIWPSSQ